MRPRLFRPRVGSAGIQHRRTPPKMRRCCLVFFSNFRVPVLARSLCMGQTQVHVGSRITAFFLFILDPVTGRSLAPGAKRNKRTVTAFCINRHGIQPKVRARVPTLSPTTRRRHGVGVGVAPWLTRSHSQRSQHSKQLQEDTAGSSCDYDGSRIFFDRRSNLSHQQFRCVRICHINHSGALKFGPLVFLPRRARDGA